MDQNLHLNIQTAFSLDISLYIQQYKDYKNVIRKIRFRKDKTCMAIL